MFILQNAMVLLVAVVPLLISLIELVSNRRRVAQARAALAAYGLTPERYLSTFNKRDTLGMAQARVGLGLN